MGLVLLGVKIIITIYIIINIIERVIKNKTRSQYLLLVLLFVMLFNDLRALTVGEVNTNFFEQLMLFVFLLYVSSQVIKNNNIYNAIMPEMIDFKTLLSSEVMSHLEEGIAIVNADNFKLLHYNLTFGQEVLPLLELIGITEIISRVSRNENEMVFQMDNKRLVYQFRTELMSRRFIVLYCKNITQFQKVKSELDGKSQYEKDIWNESELGILLLNTSGHIIYGNPKIASLFKVNFDGYAQYQVDDLFNQNENRHLFETIKEKLMISGKASFSITEKMTILNEPVKYFDIYAKVIEYESKPTIFMTITDQSDFEIEQCKGQVYNQVIKDYYIHNPRPLIYINLIEKRVVLSKMLKYKYPEFIDIEDDYTKLISSSNLKAVIENGEETSDQLINIHNCFFKMGKIIRDESNMPLSFELKMVDNQYEILNPIQIGELLIKHIRDGIAFIAPDGKIIYANEIYAGMLGYEVSEIQGRPIQELNPEMTMKSIQRKIKMTQENKSLHYEQLYQSKKGHRILVEIVAMYVESPDNEGVLLLVKNKQQEESANINVLATKYRQILETLQDDIVEITLPNRKVNYYKNEGIGKEFIGKEYTFYQWLENVHLEDQGLVNEAIDNITAEKRTEYSFEFKYFINGYWCWLRGIGSYIESDEEAYIMLLLVNIDELKTVAQDLNEYRMILTESEKVSVMAHWKFDVATSSFYIPENFKNMMAINNLSQSVISYERFLEYLHPSDRNFFEQKFKRAIWSKEELNIIVRVIRFTQIRFIQIVGDIHLDEDDLPKYIIGNIMDITDRREMEYRLKESRKLLQSIIEQSPTGIAVIKRSGKIEVINNGARKLININDNYAQTKDHILKTIASYYQNEFGGVLSDELTQLFQSDSREIRIKRIEGGTQWLSLIVSPMKNEEDILTGHILIIIDLTETLSMKEHVEEQTKRLIRAESMAKLGHFEFESQFGDLYYSEMVSDIFEIPPESQFDTNSFLQIVMPNDRLKIIDLMQKIKESEGEYQFEFDMMTAKKTYRHVMIKLIKEINKGVSHYQGTVQDLTDLHLIMKKYEKSEKEKAIIFESVNEDIVYYDAQMAILSMNHVKDDVTRERMLKLHCGSASRGKQSCENCLVEATLRTQKSLVEEQEFEERWYEKRTYPVFDNETITGVVEVTRDITKERFLRQREKILDKMKFYLTASKGISIDLNNKVMGLSGYLDIMSSIESIPEVGNTYIHLMKRVVQSIEEIIARMSLLNDNPDLSETTLDLLPILRDAKQMVEYTYNQSIILNLDSDKEAIYVRGIEEVLFNIVISVLINAVESTIYEKEPLVKVSLREELSYVHIDIEDNGVGIEEDQIDKIFEDYYSTKDRTLHAGMGLSTSRQLIVDMGGKIDVVRKNKGLIVTLTFKCVEVVSASFFIEQSNITEEKTDTFILIVDDEEIIRMLVEQVLTDAGYQVLTARDEEEAEKWVKTYPNKITVVLLDMIMPGANGRQVFDTLRAIQDNLPVVIMTGYSEDKDVKYIMAHGGLRVLKKPISNDKIIEIVSQLTRGNHRKPVDEERAINEMNGNKDLYEKICLKFYDKYQSYPEVMKQEVQTGAYDSLRKRVHSIKGVSSNVGAESMTTLGEIVEEKIAMNHPVDLELKTFIEKLEELLNYLKNKFEI